MKNIVIFDPKYRVRIYFYVFVTFLIGLIISFIYVVRQSRYYIATEIKPIIFVFNRDKIDYYNSDILEKKFNLEDDISITKFVNNSVSFNSLLYIPNDLESISSYYIIDLKGNGELRSQANTALKNLAKDFYNVFGTKLSVVSSFRSYEYQKNIKSNGCDDQFCANPGFSEHQTGLAVDLWETTNNEVFLKNKKHFEYYLWMKENAYKYGFHNTYQRGVDIDGYAIEPWHWRYVGIDLAKILYENDLTFAQYYNIFNEKNLK